MKPILRRLAVICLAVAVGAVSFACAPETPIGHATVIKFPPALSDPQTADSTVPQYVSYAAGVELDGDTVVGMTTEFPANPSWLSISGGGTDDVTIEMTDEGCSLLMRQGRSADIGVDFIGEDATDTIATLMALAGTEPDSTVMSLWTGNDGAITVDALVFTVTNDADEQVVALARAFGSIDAFVYAELSCQPGVATDTVFAQRVAPYLMAAVR